MRTTKSQKGITSIIALLVTSIGGSALQAEDNQGEAPNYLSAGIFANDSLGEQKDRWRTGSHQYSRRYFTEDEARSLELRMRTEIVAPSNLELPDVLNDRPYGNVFALGAFQTFSQDNFHYGFGGEVVITGKQTGLERIQETLHDAFGIAGPSSIDDYKIGNHVYFSARGDARYDVKLNENLRAIGYAEAGAGFETYARGGVDIVFSQHELGYVSRDYASGVPVMKSKSRPKGVQYSLIAGGDIARFEDSKLFPSWSNVNMSDTRTRLRAGLLFETPNLRVFYGMARLSPEFDEQKEDQIVGMLSLGIDF